MEIPVSKPKYTIDDLRRISPEKLDLSSQFWDELQSSTFCEAEFLLRRSIDGIRALMHAGRAAGLNTGAVVESYTGSGDIALSGDAEYARVLAHFAAGERGARARGTDGKSFC